MPCTRPDGQRGSGTGSSCRPSSPRSRGRWGGLPEDAHAGPSSPFRTGNAAAHGYTGGAEPPRPAPLRIFPTSFVRTRRVLRAVHRVATREGVRSGNRTTDLRGAQGPGAVGLSVIDRGRRRGGRRLDERLAGAALLRDRRRTALRHQFAVRVPGRAPGRRAGAAATGGALLRHQLLARPGLVPGAFPDASVDARDGSPGRAPGDHRRVQPLLHVPSAGAATDRGDLCRTCG